MRVFVDVRPARCNINLNCVYYLSNLSNLSCGEVNITLRGLTVSIVEDFLGISEELLEHSWFMIFQSTRHLEILKDGLKDCVIAIILTEL